MNWKIFPVALVHLRIHVPLASPPRFSLPHKYKVVYYLTPSLPLRLPRGRSGTEARLSPSIIRKVVTSRDELSHRDTGRVNSVSYFLATGTGPIVSEERAEICGRCGFFPLSSLLSPDGILQVVDESDLRRSTLGTPRRSRCSCYNFFSSKKKKHCPSASLRTSWRLLVGVYEITKEKSRSRSNFTIRNTI